MIAVSIFSALVHHWCSPLLWSNCGQLPSSAPGWSSPGQRQGWDGGSTPPGFDNGQRKGWDDVLPPGFDPGNKKGWDTTVTPTPTKQ
jgi:hypothetical protein